MRIRKGKKYLVYNIIIIALAILYIFTNDIDLNNNINPKLEYALVSRIIDGDTIEVILNEKEYKVRLIGIDTPEITKKKEYYGIEAKKYTESNLLNKYVFLEKDISNTDKYGRLLRYVWLNRPNKFNELEIRNKLFNAIMLLDGYANISTYQPDVKYVDYFKVFNTEARDKNMGLWNKE